VTHSHAIHERQVLLQVSNKYFIFKSLVFIRIVSTTHVASITWQLAKGGALGVGKEPDKGKAEEGGGEEGASLIKGKHKGEHDQVREEGVSVPEKQEVLKLTWFPVVRACM